MKDENSDDEILQGGEDDPFDEYLDGPSCLQPDGVWSANFERSEELVVFVRGFGLDDADMHRHQGLLGCIHAETGSDLFEPRYEGTLFSNESPDQISRELAERLNSLVGKYRRIHFIAHSMGTAFLRSAF